MIFDLLLVWLGFGTGAEVASHVSVSFIDPGFHLNLLAVSSGFYFGLLAIGLLSIVTIPRLLNLFMKEGRTYPLYGFHFLVHQAISSRSNSYFFNLLFGDSSYIIYYLRAIGFKISLKDQTGSNFGVGTEARHAFPVRDRKRNADLRWPVSDQRRCLKLILQAEEGFHRSQQLHREQRVLLRRTARWATTACWGPR